MRFSAKSVMEVEARKTAVGFGEEEGRQTSNREKRRLRLSVARRNGKRVLLCMYARTMVMHKAGRDCRWSAIYSMHGSREVEALYVRGLSTQTPSHRAILPDCEALLVRWMRFMGRKWARKSIHCWKRVMLCTRAC